MKARSLSFRLSHQPIPIGMGISVLYWLFESLLDAFLFHEGTFSQRLFPSDSNELWMRVLTVSLVMALSTLLQSNFKHRQTEKALHESHARFSDILQISGDGIIMIDASQRILVFNKGAEEIFGYEASEILDLNLTLLLPQRFARGHHRHVAAFGAEGGSGKYEGSREGFFGKRKNGEEFPAEISISKLHQNGETLFSAVVRDVTVRKQNEDAIKDLNETLERRVKERTDALMVANEEMETFCYSVSHDLRSPLRGITGFSEALLEECSDRLDERGKEYLEQINSAGIRMGELIREFLILSRVTREEMHVEEVDLSAIARSIALELGREQAKRNVTWCIAEGLTAKGDTLLLRDVLQNLLSNAWKFTSQKPQATIEFGRTNDKGKSAYYVRDDGAGFDMAYADKLFGAFQRLHSIEEFPGSGIGLATVHRIIRRHGGETWAEGLVGRGATFYFSL